MNPKVKPNLDWLLDVDLTPDLKKRQKEKPEHSPKTIVPDISLHSDPDFVVSDDGNSAIQFGDTQIRCTLDNGILKVVYSDLCRSAKDKHDNGKCKADGYLLCNTTAGIHKLKTISLSRAIKCANRFPFSQGKALAEFLDKKYLRKFLGRLPDSPGISFQWIPESIDYAAGDDGSVWSRAKGQWTRLKISGVKHGYPQVRIQNKEIYLHTAVLVAFRGEPDPGQECRHLNDRKDDNRLANLAWGTSAENQEDRRRNDPRYYDPTLYKKKLTVKEVQEIRGGRSQGESVSSLSRKYKITRKTVSQILRNEMWKYVI